MNRRTELMDLYLKNSKHSSYQILASNLQNIINIDKFTIKSTYEKERLEYILKKIDLKDKNILDIGGNSGYFTFEALNLGAKNVVYYEGNTEHSNFVKIAARETNLEDKIKVVNKFYLFDNINKKEKYDIVFLLNVIHHLGDDYGDKKLSLDEAKINMINQINNMAEKTKILILQMGFNWHGDVNKCLFKDGTKREMNEFISSNIKEKWIIEDIGIAEEINGNIQYCDINNRNIERNNKLGEFLNRPIYILKSLIY